MPFLISRKTLAKKSAAINQTTARSAIDVLRTEMITAMMTQ